MINRCQGADEAKEGAVTKGDFAMAPGRVAGPSDYREVTS